MFVSINLKRFIKCCIVLTFLALGIFSACKAINILYPMKYSNYISKFAEMYDLDRELIYAVINAESRFRYSAVSHKGASGLMQFMENTANWIAEEIGMEDFVYDDDIFNPKINIQMGSWYLNRLLRIFEDETVALAAYNAGTGNVSNWLGNPEYSSDGETLLHIPFGETRDYISKIEHYKEVYRILLKWRDIWTNE